MRELKELTQQFSQFQSESRKSTEKLKEETDNLKRTNGKNEEPRKTKLKKKPGNTFRPNLKKKRPENELRVYGPIFPEGLLKAENAEETLKAEFDSPVQTDSFILLRTRH